MEYNGTKQGTTDLQQIKPQKLRTIDILSWTCSFFTCSVICRLFFFFCGCFHLHLSHP
uniref:Uncharacterized protein n=1 Tax=Anguilla anguilla TaxID=7936 RepID=A0A0E9XFA5_ANGAN